MPTSGKAGDQAARFSERDRGRPAIRLLLGCLGAEREAKFFCLAVVERQTQRVGSQCLQEPWVVPFTLLDHVVGGQEILASRQPVPLRDRCSFGRFTWLISQALTVIYVV